MNPNNHRNFINQLNQLKSNIIQYNNNNNILNNINSYILQYNESNAFINEKHKNKIKELCQF